MGRGRWDGKRHSPKGPALFCSKPETFEKSQKSAFFLVCFGSFVVVVQRKEKKIMEHFHEQMRNFERKPEMNLLVQKAFIWGKKKILFLLGLLFFGSFALTGCLHTNLQPIAFKSVLRQAKTLLTLTLEGVAFVSAPLPGQGRVPVMGTRVMVAPPPAQPPLLGASVGAQDPKRGGSTLVQAARPRYFGRVG